MSERDLSQILGKLNGSTYAQSLALLSKAKIILLQLKALTPSPKQSSSLLSLARNVFEAGALVSIRAKDTEAFTRFVHQLTPYYELPAERYEQSSRGSSQTAQEQQNKITGLYLLLLLTQGNYSGFHTELEGLMLRAKEGEKVEEDKYLGYPIMLERWLMEGSYDLVWKAMEGGKLLPSEEYGVFSEILTTQIRSEIASSSETAYPSLPISSTKNLLFLPSEGAVVEFAQHRGWLIQDGRIYFPNQKLKSGLGADEDGEKGVSLVAIENTLGYARELETIV